MAEYIEREALIRRLKASPLGMRDASGCFVKTGIIDLVKRQPAADVVEVRHGEWFWRDNKDKSYTLCCSVCHKTEGAREEATYCPNCGAKMDGKGEGE